MSLARIINDATAYNIFDDAGNFIETHSEFRQEENGDWVEISRPTWIDDTNGDDYIRNEVSDTPIYAVNGGNDYIDNAAYGANINVDVGKNTIYNSGNQVYISSGYGTTDSIHNTGNNVHIFLSDKATIWNQGNDVEISGIEINGGLEVLNARYADGTRFKPTYDVVIYTGHGDDRIEDFGFHTSINTSFGNDTNSVNEDDATVRAGN